MSNHIPPPRLTAWLPMPSRRVRGITLQQSLSRSDPSSLILYYAQRKCRIIEKCDAQDCFVSFLNYEMEYLVSNSLRKYTPETALGVCSANSMGIAARNTFITERNLDGSNDNVLIVNDYLYIGECPIGSELRALPVINGRVLQSNGNILSLGPLYQVQPRHLHLHSLHSSI